MTYDLTLPVELTICTANRIVTCRRSCVDALIHYNGPGKLMSYYSAPISYWLGYMAQGTTFIIL